MKNNITNILNTHTHPNAHLNILKHPLSTPQTHQNPHIPPKKHTFYPQTHLNNAFGSNEFASNYLFEALPHLQSNDPKFRSKGNYTGHPGSNFKLPADC